MAENKKSFILYADQCGLFEKLPDETAGKLIKLIFDYVTDKNPKPEDILLQIAFEPIKLQLKRDLKKWSGEKSQRSLAGKKGMAKRWGKNKAGKITKHNAVIKPITNDNSVNNTITNITDTVTVTVNDTVTDILSEIEIGATIQFCVFSISRDYNKDRIVELWQAFRINGQEKNYTGREKKIKHFRNWIKTQPYENGKTHKRTIPNASDKTTRGERTIKAYKEWGLGSGS